MKKKVLIIFGIILAICALWFVASFFNLVPLYYCGSAMTPSGPIEVCDWSYGPNTY